MIDEKKLDELEGLTYIEDLTEPNWDEFYELIRLARLGLWAEKKGIPALEGTTATLEYYSEMYFDGPIDRKIWDDLSAQNKLKETKAREALNTIPAAPADKQ